MTDTGFSLSQIGQIAVRVHDVDRAVAFYRDRLGMPFLFQAPGLAFFRCGDVNLMLTLPSDPEYDHPSSILYFSVPDIDIAHQTLLDRHVEFTAAPHMVHQAKDHELWMAFFKDVDRNTLAIMCTKSLA